MMLFVRHARERCSCRVAAALPRVAAKIDFDATPPLYFAADDDCVSMLRYAAFSLMPPDAISRHVFFDVFVDAFADERCRCAISLSRFRCLLSIFRYAFIDFFA